MDTTAEYFRRASLKALFLITAVLVGASLAWAQPNPKMHRDGAFGQDLHQTPFH